MISEGATELVRACKKSEMEKKRIPKLSQKKAAVFGLLYILNFLMLAGTSKDVLLNSVSYNQGVTNITDKDTILLAMMSDMLLIAGLAALAIGFIVTIRNYRALFSALILLGIFGKLCSRGTLFSLYDPYFQIKCETILAGARLGLLVCSVGCLFNWFCRLQVLFIYGAFFTHEFLALFFIKADII